MANLNIFIDEQYIFKFRELKTLLRCNTNEETLKKLIDIAQQQLQQQFFPSPKINKENPTTNHNV